MALEGLRVLAAGILANGLHGPGIGARQDDLALGEVLAGRDAQAWFTGIELRNALDHLSGVVGVPILGVPDVAVAGMKAHAVTKADRRDALTRADQPFRSRSLMDWISANHSSGTRSSSSPAAWARYASPNLLSVFGPG